ncbi:EAL domain-containing protein [Paucibacter sp. TC2R-5]|uniref:putative bifunctional diguanylate cyclase/phosphodiesterase n=1 Tax=Paucibacter sp. TC2R-5 TaxID=2893555 RepID=UPI0021E498AD|nr:GGDEF and EAL domain-containing protein [Paucibacter sp. TC2R-5]MCV2359019.1 EAL domain-containing protein [Paucibacter sp. TC2R-5]
MLALFGMLMLLGLVQYHGLRASILADLGSSAELIAQNTSYAIVIENDTEAHELLTALATSSNLRQARLESLDGRLLAVYAGGSTHWSHSLVLLKVSRPVLAFGKPVGNLILTGSSQKLLIWTAVFLGVGCLAIFGAWLASWFSAKRAAKTARQAQQSLAWMSRHDPLTGCANREELRAHLRELQRRAEGMSALYLIDLDDFGVINAAYGAQQGDVILRVIAQRLQHLLGSADCLARLSADEFALSLTQGDEPGFANFSRKIQAVLREPIFIGNIALRPTACIGMALLPVDGADEDSAIRAASAALSAARLAGHGGFSRYAQAHDREMRERAELAEALRQALAKAEFHLHYQPIYSIHDQSLCGAEALLRWHHPTRGMISPERFIPIAESAGLIEEIGLQVLGLVHKNRLEWLSRGLKVPPIAINLSSLQFLREQSKDTFIQRLRDLELGPEALEIELTERAAFEEIEAEDSIINRLKSLGYCLSLDDFGTGYSSLSYLHRINCDKLKIDRSFVRRMEQDPSARQLVKAIVEVAHAFQMKTVAEGVETAGELEALRQVGSDAVQGYLLDRPLDANGFSTRLSTGQASR